MRQPLLCYDYNYSITAITDTVVRGLFVTKTEIIHTADTGSMGKPRSGAGGGVARYNTMRYNAMSYLI